MAARWHHDSENPWPSRMGKLIPWVFVLAALAGGIYWAGQKYPDKIAFRRSGSATIARKPGPPTTAIVATRDINFAVTAAGDIGPLDAVSVGPEIGGLISKLTLDIGDKVKKGERPVRAGRQGSRELQPSQSKERSSQLAPTNSHRPLPDAER